MNNYEDNNRITIDKRFDEKKLTIITIVIIILMFIAIGLLLNEFENYAMYYGGFIFFIAGFFVNYTVKKMGIIFLLSHGVTGLSLMCSALLNKIGLSIIMDQSTNAKIFLALSFLLMISSTIYLIKMNISDKLDNNSIVTSLLLYLIGIAMIGFFPDIMTAI